MVTSTTGLVTNNEVVYKIDRKAEGVILYVDYAKNTETKVIVSFLAAETGITGAFYNAIALDGSKIIKLTYDIISTGTYRIPLSLGRNEDVIKVVFDFLSPIPDGDSDGTGAINVEFREDSAYK